MSRGRLQLGPTGTAPLSEPIDDLLGVRAGDLDSDGDFVHERNGYEDQLIRYEQYWPGEVAKTHTEMDPILLERSHRWGDLASFQPRLLRAARLAEQGQFSRSLAPELERIRFEVGEAAEVPDGDLPALAAWCLAELLRRGGPIKVGECGLCNRPWIVQPGHDYCRRPAPNHVMSCREIAKEAAFLSNAENRGYRREYKRLHELKRRGTISWNDLQAWRQDNSPAKWKPYTAWLETAPKKTTTRKDKANG